MARASEHGGGGGGLLAGAVGIDSAYDRAVEADLASMRNVLHGDLPAGALPGQLDLADLTGFTPDDNDNESDEDPR